MLSRTDTSTGALAWFDTPIADYNDWIDAINEVENKSKKKKKK